MNSDESTRLSRAIEHLVGEVKKNHDPLWYRIIAGIVLPLVVGAMIPASVGLYQALERRLEKDREQRQQDASREFERDKYNRTLELEKRKQQFAENLEIMKAATAPNVNPRVLKFLSIVTTSTQVKGLLDLDTTEIDPSACVPAAFRDVKNIMSEKDNSKVIKGMFPKKCTGTIIEIGAYTGPACLGWTYTITAEISGSEQKCLSSFELPQVRRLDSASCFYGIKGTINVSMVVGTTTSSCSTTVALWARESKP